jgi:hypothetical protein
LLYDRAFTTGSQFLQRQYRFPLYPLPGTDSYSMLHSEPKVQMTLGINTHRSPEFYAFTGTNEALYQVRHNLSFEISHACDSHNSQNNRKITRVELVMNSQHAGLPPVQMQTVNDHVTSHSALLVPVQYCIMIYEYSWSIRGERRDECVVCCARTSTTYKFAAAICYLQCMSLRTPVLQNL